MDELSDEVGDVVVEEELEVVEVVVNSVMKKGALVQSPCKIVGVASCLKKTKD